MKVELLAYLFIFFGLPPILITIAHLSSEKTKRAEANLESERLRKEREG